LLGREVVVAQVVDERLAGGDVQLDDLVVGQALEVLDQRPQAVAVGRHQDGAPGHEVGDDGVVPVGQHPGHDVGQALGVRHDLRRQARVAGVVADVALVVPGHRGRRHVVAAAPDLHLLGAEPLGRLLLVQPLQVAVVALVQAPAAPHRDPRPPHLPQGQLGRADGPHQDRRVDDVGQDAPLGHEPAGGDRLGLTGGGQVAVVPAGEQVLQVPLALAAAEQHQASDHAGHARGGAGVPSSRPPGRGRSRRRQPPPPPPSGSRKRPTTMLTVLPGSRRSPALGLWLRTRPSWPGLLTTSSLTLATRPAPSIWPIAFSSLRPSTDGTVTCEGPDETTIVTVEPGSSSDPGPGLVLMTRPASTSEDDCGWTLTVNPALSSAARASPSVWPVTSGTATVPAPLDTWTVTAVPGGTSCPAGGSCSTIRPSSTSSLSTWTCSPRSRPAALRAWLASVTVMPRTSGTATGSGPLLTVSVTVEPTSASSPAGGSWRMTWSA